jgi:hypothetical protein
MLNGLVPPLITAAAAMLLLWCRKIYVRRGGRPWRADVAAALGIVCVTGLLEIAMGRTLIYRNGSIRPWVSEVHSDENSQQLSDWYTFSHIIHGALFYGVTHLAMGPASLGLRAAVAVVPNDQRPTTNHSQSPTPNLQQTLNWELGIGSGWELVVGSLTKARAPY